MKRVSRILIFTGLITVLVILLSIRANREIARANEFLFDPIAINDSLGNQKSPAVAYQPSTNEFLVAWTDENNVSSGTDISAQRLDADGNLLGDEITVSNAPNIQFQPDVAIRSDPPQYLVVWSEYRNVNVTDVDIWGQILGGNGSLVGNNININSRPGRQRTPATDYCSATESFLTVWDEDEDAASPWGFFIFGQRLEAATRLPVGNVITVTQDYPSPGNQQISADLICKSQHSQCLAFFRDVRDPDQGANNNEDIYGQILSCAGDSDLNNDLPITVQYSEAPGGNKQYFPSGAYNSLNDQYLIVWQDTRNDDDASTPLDSLDIYGQLLNGTGQRIGTAIDVNIPLVTANGNQEQPAVAYSHQDNIYLLVWTDYRGVDADIYGRILLPSGIPLGAEFMITNAPGEQVEPAVVFNENTGQFLIVWQNYQVGVSNGRDIIGRLFQPGDLFTLNLPLVIANGDTPSWPNKAEENALAWLAGQTNRYNSPSDIPGYQPTGGHAGEVERYNHAGVKAYYPATTGDALVSFDVCGEFGTVEQKTVLGTYGRGFIYDQAVGAIAWLMAGESEHAERLLQHVSSYQNEDGSFGFSFNGAGCNPLNVDSFYDYSYMRSGATSWIAYAFVVYYKATNDPQFLDEAELAADYLLSVQQVTAPGDPRFGLIRGGYGNHIDGDTFEKAQVEFVSTEHNIDAYFLMRDLAEATGNATYSQAAEKIRQGLLNALWNESKGRFDRGLQENEAKTGWVADTADTLDAASWGAIFLTAVGETEKAQRSLDFAHATYSEWVDGIWGYRPNAGNVDNIDWNYEYMVWSEGSLGVAMAYLKLGGVANEQRADEIIAEMAKLQTAYVTNGGLLYAVYAGLEEADFARAPSVAGTGWFVMTLQAKSDPVANNLFWDSTP